MHARRSPVRSLRRCAAVLLVGLLGPLPCSAAELAANSQAVDYNREIRPILAEHCFACHGPDEGNRQAGLRLDLRETALLPAESGQRAIVPQDPGASELIRRINAPDDDQRMPPPESNKRLTDPQRQLLARWISEGAQVQTHWSFVPPQAPALPAVKDSAWVQNDIDRFVLARLESAGLAPSPAADRLTLIRRVYLDLLGLLPTPAEADAFARDTRPEAYAELVDRLLDSPHYGERLARRWLDLARYADTNGYEKDRTRSIWPYRDWVIRSLNADLPFDQFTIQQIAGDLLPQPTLDNRVATGFHRNTMVNEEGGIDVGEFRFHSVVDRVATTGAVWLGLTVGCAQCHSHKFDPISQQEYYGLFACLNNADEPELEVPLPEIAAQRQKISQQISSLEEQRRAGFDAAAFSAWLATASTSARPWAMISPAAVRSTGGATMTVLADRSVLATGDKPNQDTYEIELTGEQLPSENRLVTALRLEVLPDESLPNGGPGRAPLFSEGDFMLGECRVELLPSGDAPPQTLKLTQASHSYAADKSPASAAIDGDLDTGWSIKGRTGQAHQAVFQLAQPVELTAGRRLRVTLEQRYIHQMTIGRFRLALATHAEAQAANFPAEVESALLVPGESRSPEQQQRLREHYLSIAPTAAELTKQIDKLRAEMPRQPTTLVMQEREPAHARVTHRAHRGEYLSPREPVSPGVLSVLHPLSADAPRNRLALAQWLVDPRNPLVARVTMNRHWQYFFGRGLVRTTEDFGLRGEAPTHPELLDYLATQFVARSWSQKQMHRLIVTSATYQQASSTTPQAIARDPDNALLARGPRLRVEGEIVRDLALSASGLLNPTLGGPSVYPPQPAGVVDLAYGSNSWPTSAGADRYRRGLYTFQKRTSPYAAFLTFDGPSGENCLVRRERSNTPLQALTLLNDAAFVEAAQALARRTLDQPADTSARCALLFRWCLTRGPSRDELADLQHFFEQQRARLTNDSAGAAAIAGEGSAETQIDRAAWTLVARAILNLDEFITKE